VGWPVPLVPARQLVQLPAPLSEYFPRGQLMQLLAPLSEYFPHGQTL
jgi:hypothetical protein